MYLVVIETSNNISSATAFEADRIFDDDVPPVFGYGRDTDTAISRLLSDYPEIVDYRLISRHEYEVLWDQHEDSVER